MVIRRNDMQGAEAQSSRTTLEALYRPYAYQHVFSKMLHGVEAYGPVYSQKLKLYVLTFNHVA
jgi:hypothetical protein